MNTNDNNRTPEIVVRAGNGTLSFTTISANGKETDHPYAVKSGMSLSANLREAFKEQLYLYGGAQKATLMVSSPVVLIPREDYLDTEDFDAEAMYSSVLTGHKGEEKIIVEMPELEAMALFSVNSDLHMVVCDNCRQVKVQNVMIPVWLDYYKRYYAVGQQRRLFAYFHDKMVDIFSYEQRRLRYANTFDAHHAHDALYFILFVWKQLGMNSNDDELFLSGDTPHTEWLKDKLKKYIRKICE